ncbi:MAG: hypothetical protein ACRDGD_07420 [Candidatus Limnocylindria bacterium]
MSDDDPGGSLPPSVPAADGRLMIVDADVDGPIMHISDALGADGPIRVAGSLFVDADGRALLCGAIAESFPPQCGGARLEVIGLELDTIELQEANGVRWAEAIELTGIVGR